MEQKGALWMADMIREAATALGALGRILPAPRPECGVIASL
jgi:hypothetical protein